MANQIAYGFEQFSTLMQDRVITIGLTIVEDAITQSMEEHNRQIDALTAALVDKTTDFQVNFLSPVVTRNQPLDEHGDPLPIVAAGHYTVAMPLLDSGNAIGSNWQTSVRMTVQELNNQIVAIQQGDVRWMMDHILQAWFQATSYTWQDPTYGALTINGLANNDTAKYYAMIGADQVVTDNHLLFQAAAIDATHNPFPAIWQELDEHPENGYGEIVALIPSNLRAAVMALPTFRPVPDANLQFADTITVLQKTLGIRTPGRLLGYDEGRVWIVEWKRLPDNYIVAFSTGGTSPFRMREDKIPELQGWVEMPATNDFPYSKRRWLRRAGFAGWNRVGALVWQVGAGSYSVPTGYTPSY